METRKRKTNLYPQSPLPNPPSSSAIFRDISNFKTPKNHARTLSFQSSPQFFTASKNTPISASRRLKSSALKSKASRRLKAFELEQSKSARKAQIQKEKSVKSLSRALTVWLNFLFENPSSCGCDVKFDGGIESADRNLSVGMKEGSGSHGKRENRPSSAVGVDGLWRGPKRQRGLLWRGEGTDEGRQNEFSDSWYSGLRASLHDICSFEDLKERMRMYIGLSGCKDIFEAMAHVTKNIDEGLLKMRASCPIVSDVGMKENAMRILMCYNPVWLRVGLYIIMGGESLLPNDDVNSEQETTFLRMVIEKKFFSHTGLAKAYSYNKQVEGLYRPGYYEKLGNIILKRFLLLVIILDRAKAHTSLPLKYGIDGTDGGSPLLFPSKSKIKSSRQLLTDFLSSDVMHGEGNLLAHLVIVGYKVTYQQNPLIEYEFKVRDLFGDLQDGVLLCRAVELLTHDSSILMKVVVPSDTQKKNLVNCGIALQYLKKAGVPLVDEDGIEIIAEDVVNGDKELILALLWNMFVYLQLPLLLNETLLSEEISNIRRVVMETPGNQTLLDLLLRWIRAICDTYDFKVENLSALLDGKAMWCLLDYYFRKEHDCSCSLEEADGTRREISIMSAIEYTDAVHNFLLSQKLTSLLGNFPEVLQVSDIIEHNGACNTKSVLVLLVFLSVQLLVKRNVDKLNFHKLLGFTCQNSISRRISMDWNNGQDSARNFKAIMTWWQDMAQQNGKCNLNWAAYSVITSKKSITVQRENAATIIQSHFRRVMERRKYLRMMDAALVLQSAVVAWLVVRKKASRNELIYRIEQTRLPSRRKSLEKFGTYAALMINRHYFVNLKKSTITIQRATRAWISHRHYQGCLVHDQINTSNLLNAATVIQSFIRGWMLRLVFDQRVTQREKASVMYEEDRRCDLQRVAAITIQTLYRGWSARKEFMHRQQAVRTIQRTFRSSRTRIDFQLCRESTITIQSHVRGWITRRKACREKHLLVMLQSFSRGWLKRKELCSQKDAAERIQNDFRCRQIRKAFLNQRNAARRIQNAFRCMQIRKDFLNQRNAATEIQRVQKDAARKIQNAFRCMQIRRAFLNQRNAARTIQNAFRCMQIRKDFHNQRNAATETQLVQNDAARKIQNAFRCMKIRKAFLNQRNAGTEIQRVKKDAARRIQNAFRCMQIRKAFLNQRNAAIEIQRFVRGVNIRKRILGSKTSKHKFQGHELKTFVLSVVKLQRWWRNILCVQKETNAAIVIQSHFRGWIGKQKAKTQKHRVVVIQSYCKGYLARKDARGQLMELRMRMQKSAANVDDSKRLINRLIAALSELLSMRSVSGILHTCATLDVATEHSQKCCEEIVAAKAIDTLLKLIRSVSRSIPDQQVLKHALSTLRNLARYPHITETLVETPGCVEIVFSEFLRNKEEGYFIASELLKKMCLNKKGASIVRKAPALLKRLNILVEELARKAGHEKRIARNLVARDHTERRFKEAVEILGLITKA